MTRGTLRVMGARGTEMGDYYRLIVAGSRSYDTEYGASAIRARLDRALEIFRRKRPEDKLVIISGGARGPDSVAITWAAANGLQCDVYPADWQTHGKKAGYLRNETMCAVADGLLAFWDHESRGTLHMVRLMQCADKDVRIVRL